jgi:hypothetical protein
MNSSKSDIPSNVPRTRDGEEASVDEPQVTLPRFVAGMASGEDNQPRLNPERGPGADPEWKYEPPPEERPTLEPPGGRWWAGWLADPLRHYTYRYWDGSDWTEHVSDGGIVKVDPLPD